MKATVTKHSGPSSSGLLFETSLDYHDVQEVLPSEGPYFRFTYCDSMGLLHTVVGNSHHYQVEYEGGEQ